MFSVNKKDFCLTLNAIGFMGKRWKRVKEVAVWDRRAQEWARGDRRGQVRTGLVIRGKEVGMRGQEWREKERFGR